MCLVPAFNAIVPFCTVVRVFGTVIAVFVPSFLSQDHPKDPSVLKIVRRPNP